MDRIRLSGLGTYTPANQTCGACGCHIVKNGEAITPIFYKDADGSIYCPGCRADVELARKAPAGVCPACSGETKAMDNIPGLLAVCTVCGGVQLNPNHSAELATEWCHCNGEHDQVYYWREATDVRRAAHGWFCTSCHGITQTG
jgi:hypothetical protein